MGVMCIVVLLALLAVVAFCLSVAEIAVGSLYLYNCSVERYIPIYLIVSGCVGVILAVTSGKDAHRTHAKARNDSEASLLHGGDGSGSGSGSGASAAEELQKQSAGEKCWSAVRSLLSLFAFIWMILGMYWVLHVHAKWSSNPDNAALYCNPNLYRFALAMVFIRLGLLVAMFVLTCCICCGILCCAACMT